MDTYILGDIHGNLRPIEQWLREYAKSGDVLIQAGDFGVGFLHPKKIESLANKLSEAGCRCLVVQGNHDDPKYFKENVVYQNGALEFLPPSSYRNIGNKGFLFLGGAISVDRLQRLEGVSWWRDEVFVLDKEFLESVEGVDYIIAHTCPAIATPIYSHKNDIVSYFSQWDTALIGDLQEEQKNIAEAISIVSNKNTIKRFIHGHFHLSKRETKEGIDYKCLGIDEMILL